MASTPSPEPPPGGPRPGTGAATATPARSNVGDPLFQRTEPQEPPPRRALLLWQYFLFPVLIVVAALGLFLLFGALGRDEATPDGLLTTLLDGGENRQQQAAQQLAILISQERTRVDGQRRAGEPVDPPPFYAAPEFRTRLLRSLTLALEEESPERQQGIAKALGRAEVLEAQGPLLDVIYPPEGRRAAPQEVRRAAATGLLHLEARAAEASYLRLAAERSDPQIRVIGYSALALLGLPRHGGAAADGPEVMRVLRAGLEDATSGVQLNAAYGLAHRGDAAGRHLIERSLSREGLQALDVAEPFRAKALTNAMGAALALRDETLRPLIERLTDGATEGDSGVRAAARMTLERWDAGGDETKEVRDGR